MTSPPVTAVCPDDLSPLNFDISRLACPQCGRKFPIIDGVVELLPSEAFQTSSAESIQLNSYAASFSNRADRSWYQYVRSILLVLGGGYLYAWASRNIERFANERSLSILDAACGDGVFRPHVSERHSYVGVDFSSRPLSRALRYHPATYYRADINHLPFPSATFDVVVSLQALQYLARPESALAELARVLKPEGQLLLTVPNQQCFKYRWQVPPRIQLQRFDRESTESLLSRHFHVAEIEARGLWFPLPKVSVHLPGVYGATVGLSWTIHATPRRKA